MNERAELSDAKRALLERRLRALRAKRVAAPRPAAAPEPEPRQDSPLVPIKPHGSYPPFFCVHASGGTVAPYVPLAHELHAEQPFYGLEAVGIDGGREPLTRIEEMAARYLEAMRATQSRGPYRLGGWSTGGEVAFEMAQRLRAGGEEVALLALLDASVPAGTDEPPPTEAILSWYMRDLGGILNVEPPALAEAELRGLPFERQLAETVRRIRAAGLLPEGPDTERTLRDRIRVFAATVAAAWVYKPRRYGGEVVLIRGASSYDHSDGWRRLSGRLADHVVPGDHYGVLRPPGLAALAAALRDCLDQALPAREAR